MYRKTFTVAEVARLLNRSEQAIQRDIDTGILHLQHRPHERRRGGPPDYEITLRDLEGYVGRAEAARLLGIGPEAETARLPAAAAPGEYKVCEACGLRKPKEAFRRDFRQPDGVSEYCRECEPRIAPR